MDQEQHKTERILSNLSKIKQVEPSPFLFAKIQHTIAEQKKGRNTLVGYVVWKPALAFMFLLVLNATALYWYTSDFSSDLTVVSEEIGLTTTDTYYDNDNY